MQLSKLSYYSDFVVYPVVIGTVATLDFTYNSGAVVGSWLAAAAGGAVLWSLMEYVLHRMTLHGSNVFAPMHGLHHASPLAYIGTPTWLSVGVLTGAILLPAWLCFGFNIADGITVGVMTGYWWYGIVHHVIHHRAHTPSSPYFRDLRAWHMRHHYSPKAGNFGVTSSFWDHVFGTVITSRDKAFSSS